MEVPNIDLLLAKTKEASTAIVRCGVSYGAECLFSHAFLLGTEMIEPSMHTEQIELEWCFRTSRDRADCFRNLITMGSSYMRSELVRVSESRCSTILNTPKYRAEKQFISQVLGCNMSL
jgi:hypothetical protein